MDYSITQSCIGCGICIKLCSVSAISGELKDIHKINKKRCIGCGVCGKACPKGAVIDENGSVIFKIPRKEWPKPVINKADCSACGICVDICGKNCLSISLPKEKGDYNVKAVLEDEKNCSGCSLCKDECPMGAISMEVVKC